jgi:hypothetical protein
MKTGRIATALVLIMTASLGHTQVNPSLHPQQPANAQFVGVWRGQFDNLPGVDMVVTDEGGQFTGAVLFYLHIRPDVNHPYTSTAGLPEPMLNLKFDGSTLTFQVSHRRAHPPRPSAAHALRPANALSSEDHRS